MLSAPLLHVRLVPKGIVAIVATVVVIAVIVEIADLVPEKINVHKPRFIGAFFIFIP